MIGAEDLLQSVDPEIRRYFERQNRHYNLPMYRKLEGLRLGKALQAGTHVKACTMSIRQRSTVNQNHLTREADPAQGDEAIVWINAQSANTPKLEASIRRQYMKSQQCYTYAAA